ncbi:MAG: hypothetical protein GXP35_04870 [Actinobacteria bacterium]|nr:hypothetical protein [Actinomycetota bacterium]
MKQRFIREGDSIDDDSELVLRGGDLDPTLIRSDAQRMYDIYGSYGISVFALRGATLAELARQPPLVRFAVLSLITARTISAAGLRLEATGRNRRHFTLILGDLELGIKALAACGYRSVQNPYHEP